jgi:hypothetical protein
VRWSELNAQGQPKITWPPSFALARAYTDQLERKGCVAPARLGELRAGIAAAEKGTGAARNAGLDKALAVVEAERGCDPRKSDLLKGALQGLRPPAM